MSWTILAFSCKLLLNFSIFGIISWLGVMFSFVSVSQVIGWEGWVFCTSQRFDGEIAF